MKNTLTISERLDILETNIKILEKKFNENQKKFDAFKLKADLILNLLNTTKKEKIY